MINNYSIALYVVNNTTMDYAIRLAKEAKEALHNALFPAFRYSEYNSASFDTQRNEYYNGLKKAKEATYNALVEVEDELSDQLNILWACDLDNDLTEAQIDEYVDLASEQDKVLEYLRNAIESYDEAVENYKQFEEAMANITG